MKHKSFFGLYLCVVLAGVAFKSTFVYAEKNSVIKEEQSKSPDMGIEDIIVTAQRREESLQGIPLSLIAIGRQSLENYNIYDINDLQTVVPTVQITPYPALASSSRVFIRGVGNTDDQVTSDPSVAVYYDGVYVARTQGLGAELADIERIEVLRGPQGSLYGRNATGGAINYISRPPNLEGFNIKQTVMVGNYEQFRSRTALNIPLSNTIAVGLSYLHSERNGVVSNLGTGKKRFGDLERNAYRIAARWVPADAIDVRYTYDRANIKDTPVFLSAMLSYPKMIHRPKRSSSHVENLRAVDTTIQGHSLTASWELSDAITIKSITAYRKLDNDSYQDYIAGVFYNGPTIHSSYVLNEDQFSQEIQLTGDLFNERLSHIFGAYYFKETADTWDQVSVYVFAPQQTTRYVDMSSKAYAFYGQLTYRPQIFDGLYFTSGLRWSRDNRKARRRGYAEPIGGGFHQNDSPAYGDRSFSNVSPSVILGYDTSEGFNLYAKYGRGYKSGGFNNRASNAEMFNRGYGEETLDAFELGLKSTWFNNQLRVNLALYRSEYKDIQTSIPSDPNNVTISDVFNAGRARIQGNEVEVSFLPTHDFKISANYAYLDAKYTKIRDLSGKDISGNYVFINAPRHMLNLAADWDIAETSIGRFSVFVDYALQSSKYTQANLPTYKIKGYGILNGRASLSNIPTGFGGDWKFSVFGKNLTNKVYLRDLMPTIVPVSIIGDPRTYGIELTVEY